MINYLDALNSGSSSGRRTSRRLVVAASFKHRVASKSRTERPGWRHDAPHMGLRVCTEHRSAPGPQHVRRHVTRRRVSSADCWTILQRIVGLEPRSTTCPAVGTEVNTMANEVAVCTGLAHSPANAEQAPRHWLTRAHGEFRVRAGHRSGGSIRWSSRSVGRGKWSSRCRCPRSREWVLELSHITTARGIRHGRQEEAEEAAEGSARECRPCRARPPQSKTERRQSRAFGTSGRALRLTGPPPLIHRELTEPMSTGSFDDSGALGADGV